ncbi:hypothetical protein EIN_525230 [Entamoeba invadens IP1]|uniref:Uncharacterized protein n=1 Tax=Entamoeba invadens IP1 TaxID=370355 RepID=A0A0A1U5F7_ENTIV|nr:hypothetical protein EIN_525230 [Entamoeba invadens IP1]ELP89568.1 hypothetical protein EIN_525230 [Entamoeba invadens IP1]|eukprot:XP_004256339.1 hypothetical protein EIN_525230 [Entamoeba invadens IP1]
MKPSHSTMSASSSSATEEVIKQRKRDSRNEEGLVLNAMIYLLAGEGYSVTVIKTKRTTNTNKMLIPETITSDDGQIFTQDDIRPMSDVLLRSLGYEPITLPATSPKQIKRNREAQMSNGVLYFLTHLGFLFMEKKTKKASVTERLVRVVSITKENMIYTKDDLFNIGEFIENLMADESTSTSKVVFNAELLAAYDDPLASQYVQPPTYIQPTPVYFQPTLVQPQIVQQPVNVPYIQQQLNVAPMYCYSYTPAYYVPYNQQQYFNNDRQDM